ncbi:hypothetical protein PENSPDRAFT_153580 [Peniophora sp. CONT]|nr:hypothetical protein PENSPDRAFT_153580 [Peniophora sp. CONT]
MTWNDLLQTCNSSVESISADIWDALVATELPIFWLDVALQENPVHGRIVLKIFHCVVPFTSIWLRELVKVPDERRDHISASFAGVFISKFISLYSVLWRNREQLKQQMVFDVFGRLAYDLTRIHAHYDLPKQQLANGKVAHLVLFTLSNRDRLFLTLSASARDLEAFQTVSSAIISTRGHTVHHSWIQDLVKAVGPEDLMDALGTVVFHPSITDVTLAAFASAMITMIYNVPECLAVIYRDPLGHTQQCARAIERQLADKTRVPVLKWAQDIVVWENLYRLCL